MSLIEGPTRWREGWNQLRYWLRELLWPVAPSSVPGMGALPHADRTATTFRVWAPHADHLFVAGDFNRWSRWQTPLAMEDNGYWSAEVKGATVGDRYKYVIHHGGEMFHRTDPYAREVTDRDQNGTIFPQPIASAGEVGSPHLSFSLRPRNELVIYELHVGTFSRPGNSEGGTFQGVIDRLPYLQDLGVNAIELMPVAEFAGDFSWGYNPAHLFAVTRTYGGVEALRSLVNAAHSHGIAVLVDVVYNHFGPEDLSLWRFDGWYQNDKGGIYFYNDWRSRTPWADTRPDYGRAEVRRFILDNVRFWLEEIGADGLRWDATSYIRNAHGHDGDRGADIADGWRLLREANEHVSEKLMIAEDMQGNAALTRSLAEGGAGFDAQWDANFVHTLRRAIITSQDEDRDMEAVADAIGFSFENDPFARVIFTESHDEVANGQARVPEDIAPGDAGNLYARRRAILGAAIVLTTPGIPMLFQGQEFLESGWFDDTVPLDWDKARRHHGVISLFRELIGLRLNRSGNSRGLLGPNVNVYHRDNEAKLLAFHRWQHGGPGDDVVVVANFSHSIIEGESIGFPRRGYWRVRFNSDREEYDSEFTGWLCPDIIAAPAADNGVFDGLDYWGNVTLAPYSVLLFSQDSDKS